MATEEKDLQYYLDNPDELPTDPEVLARLAEQMNGIQVPAEDPAKQDEKSATTGAEGDKKADEPEAKTQEDPATKADGKTEEPEEGDILTRDGKRTIPYDVLKTERERRHAAEETVARLSADIESIKEQLAKGTTKGDQAAAAMTEEAAGLLSPEELAALKEDFPVFGKVVDSLLGTIKGLEGKVDSLTQQEQNRETDIRQSVATTVQGELDNSPVLTYLQANDPTLFAKAVEQDNLLKGNPKYPDLASRFQKVSEIMEDLYGPFPGVTAKAPEAPQPKPTESKETIRKAVAEKVAAKSAAPKSLSDLPNAEAPASSEENELETLSALEITDKLMKMTPDQRTAFMNKM